MESENCGGIEVWSWGAGTHGQLACGTLVDALVPQRVEALSAAAPIVDIACGGAHGVAVFDSGDVATWGRGQAGALGHGDETTITVPRLVSSLQGIRITRAAAGWNHSAFLTDNGELYTCGDGAFGQLGHGNTESRLLPCRVEHLSSVCINMVACGMRHTLALCVAEGSSEASIVYAFGFNKRGQLGIGMSSGSDHGKWRVSFPQRVQSLDMHGVASVSANGDHSAALTGRGEVFLWGRGYNDAPDSHQPHLARMGLKCSQLSLGWRHGLALTENKEVFAWGNNRCGQLGTSRPSAHASQTIRDADPADESTNLSEERRDHDMSDQNELLSTAQASAEQTTSGVHLERVDTQGMGALWISAGSEHSAAVLEDGKVIVWGWAEHGQLGLGSLEDQDVPHVVSLHSSQESLHSSGAGKGTQHGQCKSVLSKLHGAMNKDGRQIAALFLELPKRSELPEYYKVIARPITAHQIEEKLDRLEYPSVLEFASDFHLMIDNAVHYYSTSAEVQADARRLQALFDSRMSLVFPEVDFSSARVRSYPPVLPQQSPSVSGSRSVLQAPVVTGPRGVLQGPIVTGPRGVRRPPPPAVTEHVETPTNARSSTRISLVRHHAPPQEVVQPKQEGKSKSKKGGKEKSKDKKGKSKSKAKSSVKEKELVHEEVESDEGIMHPVDLVIHKKKRKGREHTGSRTVVSSQLVFNTEEMRETAARGFSVGSSGNARGSQQHQVVAPRSRAPAASPASSRRSAPQPDMKVAVGAAVPVLKKSRSDGGKRRPSHP